MDDALKKQIADIRTAAKARETEATKQLKDAKEILAAVDKFEKAVGKLESAPTPTAAE